ncbi:MAG: 4-hydroxy-tetrahydrodipicolinate synthase [Promethearchaeota archaeon]
MVKDVKLEGNFVALITPLDKDLNVDEEALRNFVEHQIKNGIHGLVPMGTTGESATMSHPEHRKIIDIVIDQAKGRVPVLAGTGSNSTAEAIGLTKYALDAGADAGLVICPYYNKPTQRGLINHFTKVAEAAKELPLVLYNVPSRTGRNIEADTTIKLSKIKNIVAIKEASGNVGQIMKIINGTSDDFIVLSGDDSLTYTICTLGGKGVVSVASNVATRKVSDMCEKLLANDFIGARKIHYELLDLFGVLFIETNPAPAKAAAKMMNLANTQNWYLRPPLIDVTPESNEKIKVVLQKLKLI